MMFRKRAAGIERVSVLIIHLLFKVLVLPLLDLIP